MISQSFILILLFGISETAIPGYKVVNFQGTYEAYSKSSMIFQSTIRPRRNSLIHLVGSGTAVGALVAARLVDGQVRIIASDIDHLSVSNGRYNVSRSPYRDIIEVCEADLFNVQSKYTGQKVSSIYINMPIYSNVSGNIQKLDKDMKLLNRVLSEAGDHLLDGGTLELSYVESPKFLERVYAHGWEVVLISGAEMSRELFENHAWGYHRFVLMRAKDVSGRRTQFEEYKKSLRILADLQC